MNTMCEICGCNIYWDVSDEILGPIDLEGLQQICIECPDCGNLVPVGLIKFDSW